MLPAEVRRHHFTVEECHGMGETGMLSEGDWVGIMDGEVVEMPPPSDGAAPGA